MSAHRLVLAAASPLLKEAMSQDLADQVVIIVPEVTSIVMTAILDLVYKGRMNITPTSTWAIRSLVEILKINAEDVSVISAGAKKLTPAITLRVPVSSPKAPAKAVQQPQTSVTPQPQNNGAPELVSSRGRKRKQTVPPPKIPAKVARGKNLQSMFLSPSTQTRASIFNSVRLSHPKPQFLYIFKINARYSDRNSSTFS